MKLFKVIKIEKIKIPISSSNSGGLTVRENEVTMHFLSDSMQVVLDGFKDASQGLDDTEMIKSIEMIDATPFIQDK